MKGMTNASPGVGQFAAGKLGTIKGGTTDGSVQAQEDGTGTVVGWSGKADTADVAKKADKTALDATDAKVTQIQTAVGDCFNAAEITSDGKLQLTAVDGQVNALTLPKNGGQWKLFTETLGGNIFVFSSSSISCTKTIMIQYIHLFHNSSSNQIELSSNSCTIPPFTSNVKNASVGVTSAPDSGVVENYPCELVLNGADKSIVAWIGYGNYRYKATKLTSSTIPVSGVTTSTDKYYYQIYILE